jgi:hypothetical protein
MAQDAAGSSNERNQNVQVSPRAQGTCDCAAILARNMKANWISR